VRGKLLTRPNVRATGVTTDDIIEGAAKYYSTATALSDVRTQVDIRDLSDSANLLISKTNLLAQGIDTDDLSEGTVNVFYTQARFDAAYAVKDETRLQARVLMDAQTREPHERVPSSAATTLRHALYNDTIPSTQLSHQCHTFEAPPPFTGASTMLSTRIDNLSQSVDRRFAHTHVEVGNLITHANISIVDLRTGEDVREGPGGPLALSARMKQRARNNEVIQPLPLHLARPKPISVPTMPPTAPPKRSGQLLAVSAPQKREAEERHSTTTPIGTRREYVQDTNLTQRRTVPHHRHDDTTTTPNQAHTRVIERDTGFPASHVPAHQPAPRRDDTSVPAPAHGLNARIVVDDTLAMLQHHHTFTHPPPMAHYHQEVPSTHRESMHSPDEHLPPSCASTPRLVDMDHKLLLGARTYAIHEDFRRLALDFKDLNHTFASLDSNVVAQIVTALDTVNYANGVVHVLRADMSNVEAHINGLLDVTHALSVHEVAHDDLLAYLGADVEGVRSAVRANEANIGVLQSNIDVLMTDAMASNGVMYMLGASLESNTQRLGIAENTIEQLERTLESVASNVEGNSHLLAHVALTQGTETIRLDDVEARASAHDERLDALLSDTLVLYANAALQHASMRDANAFHIALHRSASERMDLIEANAQLHEDYASMLYTDATETRSDLNDALAHVTVLQANTQALFERTDTLFVNANDLFDRTHSLESNAEVHMNDFGHANMLLHQTVERHEANADVLALTLPRVLRPRALSIENAPPRLLPHPHHREHTPIVDMPPPTAALRLDTRQSEYTAVPITTRHMQHDDDDAPCIIRATHLHLSAFKRDADEDPWRWALAPHTRSPAVFAPSRPVILSHAWMRASNGLADLSVQVRAARDGIALTQRLRIDTVYGSAELPTNCDDAVELTVPRVPTDVNVHAVFTAISDAGVSRPLKMTYFHETPIALVDASTLRSTPPPPFDAEGSDYLLGNGVLYTFGNASLVLYLGAVADAHTVHLDMPGGEQFTANAHGMWIRTIDEGYTAGTGWLDVTKYWMRHFAEAPKADGDPCLLHANAKGLTCVLGTDIDGISGNLYVAVSARGTYEMNLPRLVTS